MPIALRLAESDASNAIFADALADMAMDAFAAAEAFAEALMSAEAAARAFTAPDGNGAAGNAGGTAPCNP
ncbi:MAG: hypothetical protein WCL32_25095 [Planctomycetota bacterium]